jgi:hypothetical protein
LRTFCSSKVLTSRLVSIFHFNSFFRDELRESLAMAREAADVALKSNDKFDYVYFANLASILLTINTRESILEAAGVLAKVCSFSQYQQFDKLNYF